MDYSTRKKYRSEIPVWDYVRWNLSDDISIGLPEGFEMLSEHDKRQKYSGTNRPALVIGNDNGSVNFTFQLLNKKSNCPEKQLQEATEILQRLDRKIVFYDSGRLTKGKISSCWKEYKSFAVDGVVYNQIIFIGYNARLILATFHCPFKDYSQWKIQIPDILGTISMEENNDERIQY